MASTESGDRAEMEAEMEAEMGGGSDHAAPETLEDGSLQEVPLGEVVGGCRQDEGFVDFVNAGPGHWAEDFTDLMGDVGKKIEKIAGDILLR